MWTVGCSHAPSSPLHGVVLCCRRDSSACSYLPQVPLVPGDLPGDPLGQNLLLLTNKNFFSSAV